jgi:hypothetical protein
VTHRALLARALALAFALAACAGPNNSVVLYEGPDRPDDVAALGPPPPSDYRAGSSRREIDSDGDHRPDRVEFISDGVVKSVGEDTNRDGRMDVYRKVSNGHVTEEVRDTDFDGVFDVRAIDSDSDGRLDKLIQLPATLNLPPSH